MTIKIIFILFLLVTTFFLGCMASSSEAVSLPSIQLGVDDVEEPEKLVPEGIEGRVPYKGKLSKIIEQLVGGLRQSMGYTGCKDITELQTKTEFVRITDSGKREGHVHDVSITKEAPNYSVD